MKENTYKHTHTSPNNTKTYFATNRLESMEDQLKKCHENLNGLEEKSNERFDNFEKKLMDKLPSMLAQIIVGEKHKIAQQIKPHQDDTSN